MEYKVLWFSAVLGYVIQSRSISAIHSNPLLLNPKDNLGHSISSDKLHHALTIYLTFLYFASLLLLLPIVRFIHSMKIPWLSLGDQMYLDDQFEYELQYLIGNNNTTNNERHSIEVNEAVSEEREASPVYEPESMESCIKYFLKLFVLALLLLVPAWSYILALSLSPVFDISLIQNTAVFEIVTLLYGVCGISRRNHVFRDYLVMMAAVIAILIISYTKATCDILGGKLSINPQTGEVTDQYLFNRLEGALICGMGALPLGGFAVLWNKWINGNKAHPIELSKHLSRIGFIAIILLSPFTPDVKSGFHAVSVLHASNSFWLCVLGTIFCGIIPNLLSLLYLNRIRPPEYITTCFLGSIISMGILEWVCEPIGTAVIRWEVIGYIILSLCCVFLSKALS